MSNDLPRYPASFINAIREEGTKEEACNYLQQIWDQLCEMRETEKDASVSHGVYRIGLERERQVKKEGFDTPHDDANTMGEMAAAAATYALAACVLIQGHKVDKDYVPNLFPPHWDKKFWKPADDPIRNLEKAGALIAAEIDRLHRLKNPS